MDEITKANQKPPFWRQLRWTLILFFVLLAAVPVIVAVTITLNREIEESRNQVFRQLESIAQLKQDQIVRWISDAGSSIDLFLAEPAREERIISFIETSLLDDSVINRNEQEAVNNLLTQAVVVIPLFEEFFLYNAKGLVIAASNPAQIGKVVTAQPYYKSSLVEQNYVQTPYYEIGRDELALFLTHRLTDVNREETVGVLAARFSLDTLGQIMLERAGLGETGETYLISPVNNYLLTPSRFEEEGYIRNRAYHSEGIDQALKGENGSGLYGDYRDPPVQVFGVYRWVPEMQVGLLAEADEAEVLASAVQSRNLSIVFTGVTILIAALVGLVSATRISRPITNLAQVATSIAAGNLEQRAEVKQANEIGLLATSFNAMTAQLRSLVGSLEERVASRTRRLETVAAVTERVSAILEVDRLLQEVVDQVQAQFVFYHTHIYLLDDEGELLVLAEGAGQAGQEMKRAGHTIPLSAPASLVARSARTGEVVWVDNVREDETWLPNPFLPDTYSEMAVPIILEGKVVGVLDVQEDEIAGFDESDANVLRSLANQVAVAIRNAQFFEQVENALTEARVAQERYVAQAWDKIKREQAAPEHLYVRAATLTIGESILENAEKLALAQQYPVITSLDIPGYPNADSAKETLNFQQTLLSPVKLGNQTIGALQLHRVAPSGPLEQATPSWTEEDLALVEAVLDQVAQSAETLRLFEETRDRAGRERLIGQVSDRLRRAPDLDTLMKTAVGELSRILGPDRAFVRFGSETELGGQAGDTPEVRPAEPTGDNGNEPKLNKN